MTMEADLGSYKERVETTMRELEERNIVSRMWAHDHHDHMVWKPEPTEIVNRLGWLSIVGHMKEHADELTTFAFTGGTWQMIGNTTQHKENRQCVEATRN